MTYGYLTKNLRIENNLPKTHCVDARCISGHPDAVPLGYHFAKKKVRCHNRQLHKATINKGGVKKRSQLPYEVKGFRMFDKVKVKDREWYIYGRRTKGSFVLKSVEKSKNDTLEITPSKITFIHMQKGWVCERKAI